jgi:hypothetical protein
MEVSLAFLADAANVAQGGKVNVLGIFERFNCPGLPGIGGCFSVVRLAVHPGEEGAHRIGYRLRDEDGNLAWSSPTFDFAVGISASPGTPNAATIVSQLLFPLPVYGELELEIVVDGNLLGLIPVGVSPVPPNAQQG